MFRSLWSGIRELTSQSLITGRVIRMLGFMMVTCQTTHTFWTSYVSAPRKQSANQSLPGTWLLYACVCVVFWQAYESSLQQQRQQPVVIETLPQTQLSQSPDLLRHIPPTAVPPSRLVSSDQLPRRASAAGRATMSCPYYKSELYIVSEEQAFRSQPGRPFRNDVADCVAVASSSPPSVMLPHRSFLQTPDIAVDSRQPDFVMRHSYSGSLPGPGTAAQSVPITLSASSLSSVQQHERPLSANRRSLTESKWKWLHSNAMVQDQPSPISLRRTIPSELVQSPRSQDLRQQSASTNFSYVPVTDTQASRQYYSQPVVDRAVHRSADEASIRHWRHSLDNTTQLSAFDTVGPRRDSYGLTLSLSGAAVSRSGQVSGGTDVSKSDVSTNAAAHSTGDLPQKLPIERIMRFDCPSAASQRPSEVTQKHYDDSSETVSRPLTATSGRSGRLSVPNSIPIYFRAEPSTVQSQQSSSRVMKTSRGDNRTVPYSTDGRQQPLAATSNRSSPSCSKYTTYIDHSSVIQCSFNLCCEIIKK